MMRGQFTHISPITALPHGLLKPFVNHYAFHNEYVPNDALLEKKLYFSPDTSIDFFIGDPFKKNKRNAKKLILKTRAVIRTPRAFKKCTPGFTGHFISFSIRFHPTGLHSLLGIPMDRLGNNSIAASELGLLPIEEITDRMMYASDIGGCIKIVEPFLLTLATKYQPLLGFTERAAQKIIHKKGLVSINELSSDACQSVSQLERDFIKKVGESPKKYACMQRLFRLISDKAQNPDIKWSALAYQYGYFDPIHLTREFNNYFSFNPSGFVPSDYILV